jgi:hypothetical protein
MQLNPEPTALLLRARPFLQNLRIISQSVIHAEAYEKKYGKTIWRAISETESAIYHLEEMSSGIRHQINTGLSRLPDVFQSNK